MRNVLVTGGAGFIGSNFVRFVLEAEGEVQLAVLDAFTYAGSPENLKDLPHPERYTLYHGDICDRDLVERIYHQQRIDTVVHFAAETHVDRSIANPDPFVRTNVQGTFTLLEAARQAWITESMHPLESVRFHHVSTDEVYGRLGPGDPAFSESTPYDPSSPYSATKAASDHLVRAYHRTYGLPITISNCSNNYGPHMFPEKLIPLMILNAVQGISLPVYGDGQQIRDWLYVEDHCEAIWAILSRGRIGETYAIGGGNQPTNLAVVTTLCDILDELQPDSPYTPHNSLIRYVADRPGHDRRYAMDITKISTELGWMPRQSLAAGLLKTVQWYLDHPEWVEAIRKQQDYQRWLESNYASRGEAK